MTNEGLTECQEIFLGFLEKVFLPKSSEKLFKLSLSFLLVTVNHNYEAWNNCSHLATYHLEDKALHPKKDRARRILGRQSFKTLMSSGLTSHM